MASIKLTGDTSGEITISAPAVAGTNTLTLPAETGTVGIVGPTFSAYLSSAQSISSSTSTKLTFNTEEFDTNSNYDNATNYRFTPTIAGYYQINAIGRASGTSVTTALIDLFKNGSVLRQLASSRDSTSSSQTLSGSAVVQMNGTTDYLEIYGTITGTSPSFLATHTNFSGFLVRTS